MEKSIVAKDDKKAVQLSFKEQIDQSIINKSQEQNEIIQNQGALYAQINLDQLKDDMVKPGDLVQNTKAHQIVLKQLDEVYKFEDMNDQFSNEMRKIQPLINQPFHYLKQLNDRIYYSKMQRESVDPEDLMPDIQRLQKCQEKFKPFIESLGQQREDMKKLLKSQNGLSKDLAMVSFNKSQGENKSIDEEEYLANIALDNLKNKYKQKILNESKTFTELFSKKKSLHSVLKLREIRINELDKKIEFLKDQIEGLQKVLEKLPNNEEKENLLKQLEAKCIETQKQFTDSDVSRVQKFDEQNQKLKQGLFKIYEELTSVDHKSTACHFILILDQSSSFEDYFGDMKEAFQQFLEVVSGSGNPDHRLSVIMLSTKAEQRYFNVEVSNDLDINPTGGGTSFPPSAEMAEKNIEYVPDLNPVILFITDGEDPINLDKTCQIFSRMYKNSGNKLLTFTIAFGQYAKQDDLLKICQSGNGGREYRMINGETVKMNYCCKQEKNLMQKLFKNISMNFNKKLQEKESQYEQAQKLSEKINNKEKQEILEHQEFQRQILEQQKRHIQDLRVQETKSMEEEKNQIEEKIKDFEQQIEILRQTIENQISDQQQTSKDLAFCDQQIKQTFIDKDKQEVKVTSEDAQVSEQAQDEADEKQRQIQQETNQNPEKSQREKFDEEEQNELLDRFFQYQALKYQEFTKNIINDKSEVMKNLEQIKLLRQQQIDSGFTVLQKSQQLKIQALPQILKKDTESMYNYLQTVVNNLENLQECLEQAKERLLGISDLGLEKKIKANNCLTNELKEARNVQTIIKQTVFSDMNDELGNQQDIVLDKTIMEKFVLQCLSKEFFKQENEKIKVFIVSYFDSTAKFITKKPKPSDDDDEEVQIDQDIVAFKQKAEEELTPDIFRANKNKKKLSDEKTQLEAQKSELDEKKQVLVDEMEQVDDDDKKEADYKEKVQQKKKIVEEIKQIQEKIAIVKKRILDLKAGKLDESQKQKLKLAFKGFTDVRSVVQEKLYSRQFSTQEKNIILAFKFINEGCLPNLNTLSNLDNNVKKLKLVIEKRPALVSEQESELD